MLINFVLFYNILLISATWSNNTDIVSNLYQLSTSILLEARLYHPWKNIILLFFYFLLIYYYL